MIFLFAVCPVCDAGRKGFFDRDSAEGSTACDVWWSTFASCHHLISPKNFGKVLAWLIVSHMFHLDSNRLVFLGWVETTNQLFRLFRLVLRQSLFVFLQCRLCRTRTQVRPAAKLAGRPDTPLSLTTIDSDKWLKSVERLTTGNKLQFFLQSCSAVCAVCQVSHCNMVRADAWAGFGLGWSKHVTIQLKPRSFFFGVAMGPEVCSRS